MNERVNEGISLNAPSWGFRSVSELVVNTVTLHSWLVGPHVGPFLFFYNVTNIQGIIKSYYLPVELLLQSGWKKLLYYFKWLWNNKANKNLRCQKTLFSWNFTKNSSTRSPYKIYTKGESRVTDYWVPHIIFTIGTRMFAMQQCVVKIKISSQVSRGHFSMLSHRMGQWGRNDLLIIAFKKWLFGINSCLNRTRWKAKAIWDFEGSGREGIKTCSSLFGSYIRDRSFRFLISSGRIEWGCIWQKAPHGTGWNTSFIFFHIKEVLG